MTDRSRFSGFYRRTVRERLDLLCERGFLAEEDWQSLASGAHALSREGADRMVENVIGVFGLPLGVGLGFLVNGRDHVVPLVVEEPSIIAALSSAALLARRAGGFVCEAGEPLLIGQIQVVDAPHPVRAQAAVLQHKAEILNLANSLHPRMVARGGGARDVEVALHPGGARRPDMLVVHLLVDTRDAMGANLVNTMCEGVAPLVESITGGKVFLRILSNLADRALVRARVELPPELLGGKRHTGGEVRDGIILANEFAAIDPYRAATHNKGIMNGVDAVALATGNDWRAIEAAAHAYAARGQRYTALTRWFEGENGSLVGVLEMPMKVGIVGGSLQCNPAARIALRLLGVRSARELAEVMGAVGLAQNLAALRALVTEGIQRGHMTLHARSVASSAGAPPELFDEVVERLIDSGEIKVWKAKEILDTLQGPAPAAGLGGAAAGFGKVILLGEHAVVYGSHAIAAPVPLAIESKVSDGGGEGVHLLIPRWGVEDRFDPAGEHRNSLHQSIALILDRLGLVGRAIRIEVSPHVPRAMGLGGSAALAVSVIRAVSLHFGLGLGDEEVSRLAYECEKVAHGNPSGIDNTLATFGRPLLFRRGEPPYVRELQIPRPIPIVVGMTGVESLTARMVASVRAAWEHNPALYERIFREIDALALEGVKAIEAYDLATLGELMNVCQGLLNALGVSTWELEELVQIARRHGAAGAKLTGGGGGGSMIALCPEGAERVVEAMSRAGYRAFATEVG
ncbi:MAG TPA: hydroxymethylglutaryl-CoA reductase, degradative [Thermoanaerobaculaceae bacterium]|nr:hydroxymethylglutaryl-CoA reductase, degradative [Thermoanaerobaculaceae bacterium]HRS16840.1 hydroxymethylglutaryl-CoA reductase, degradative [Thermoanaerobaculaceae bacterium]